MFWFIFSCTIKGIALFCIYSRQRIKKFRGAAPNIFAISLCLFSRLSTSSPIKFFIGIKYFDFLVTSTKHRNINKVTYSAHFCSFANQVYRKGYIPRSQTRPAYHSRKLNCIRKRYLSLWSVNY